MRNKNFKIGDKVKWNDPAIHDYDPEDREEQLNRVYEVVDKYGDIILIADDFSETEVLAHELIHT